MIGFGGVLTDEEIFVIDPLEWSFAGMGHGRGMGRGGMVSVRTRGAADDERRNGEPIFEF